MLLPAAQACEQGAAAPLLVELVATSDRGDAFDRSFTVRVHADGCLALRRPAFHREPGAHAGQLDTQRLQSLRAQVAEPTLRTLDPAAALASAQARLAAASAAEGGRAGGERATYVSHPTWYRLRLFDAAGDLQHELVMESILQHAELHPQDAALALLADTVRQLLDLAEDTPTRRAAASEPAP